ncbi:hypothetical protein GOP47_0029278 [Adiantum capillus-veneris]|nr:hypothetical protein GOP47_0029278 [Adiantum capillus-veneris]
MTTRAIERDEDLTLFHEMQRRDHERRNMAMRPVLDNSSIEVHSARFASSSLYKLATSGVVANVYRVRTAGEELLASDMGKNDYDWLLTPPGTPLVTGSENDPMADMAFVSAKKGPPNLVRSLATIKTTRLSRESSATLDPTSRAARSNPVHVPNRRSSLAPTSATSSSRPTSRPSTPTSRPVISSSTASSSNRSMAASSTTRSSASSRSMTPLRRPSTPVLSHTTSQPKASIGGRSSSASKVSSLPSRSAPASRGSSPTTRTRALQPSAMPGFSLEAPPNLRTSVPTRSVSNSRGASVSSSSRQMTATTPTIGSSRQSVSSSLSSMMPSTNFSKPGTLSSPSRPARPGASLLSTGSSRPASSSSSSVIPRVSTSSPSSTTSSSRTADPPIDRARRQSCSPSVTQGRTPTAERSASRNGRGDCSPCDPAGSGSKMVDRMMQSRRAAALSLSPEKMSVSHVRRVVKPTTPIGKDNAGYGKAMSRKPIDMALRHMDMCQSASNALRPLVSNMPSSSFYTIRSLSGRGGIRPGHSPLTTTSSTASSEHSMSIVRDLEGSELEDVGSEVGSRASPRSVQDCMFSIAKEARVTKWVDCGDFNRESSIEMMQRFRKGMEKVGGLDSPVSVCCPHHLHGGGAPCELCNIKSRLQSLKASPMSAAESLNLSYGVASPASSVL